MDRFRELLSWIIVPFALVAQVICDIAGLNDRVLAMDVDGMEVDNE